MMSFRLSAEIWNVSDVNLLLEASFAKVMQGGGWAQPCDLFSTRDERKLKSWETPGPTGLENQSLISNWLKINTLSPQAKTQINTQFWDKDQMIGMCTNLLIGLRCFSVSPFSWTKWLRKKKWKKPSPEAQVPVLTFREKQIYRRLVSLLSLWVHGAEWIQQTWEKKR